MIQLVATSSGKTEYSFADRLPDSNETHAFICQDDTKGTFLASAKDFSGGMDVISITNPFFLPIGVKWRHICFSCACVASNIKTLIGSCLGFCSISCLEKAESLIDVCGSIVEELLQCEDRFCSNPSSSSKHREQLLAVLVLFSNLQHARKYGCFSNLLKNLLSLQPYLDLDLESSQRDTNEFIASLTRHCAPLLQVLGDTQEGAAVVSTVIKVIRLNSQVIAVPMVTATYLMIIDHVISRLNHSCAANCALVPFVDHISRSGDVRSGGPVPIVLRLRTTRFIECGEELTISYLSNPLASVCDRQATLESAFNFRCDCSRCTSESRCSCESNSCAGGEIVDRCSCVACYSEGGGQILEAHQLVKAFCEDQVGLSPSTTPPFMSLSSMKHLINLVEERVGEETTCESNSYNSSTRAGGCGCPRLLYASIDCCVFVLMQSKRASRQCDDADSIEWEVLCSRVCLIMSNFWKYNDNEFQARR